MTDSKMTDDMDLKERYNESLAAIEGSRKADQANAVLRRELKEYISQMDDAMDRAGIEVPENFEEIVKMMDRKDLTGEANETSNWSKHLLTEKFDQKLESEFDGRYNDVFTDTSEVKHQRGLAQIYLLDRQLQEISRKAKHPAVLVDDQSASSQIEDKTFITAKDTIDNEAESRQASLPVEPTSEEKEEPIEELKEEEIDRFNFLLSVDDENFIKRDELLQMYKQVEMECTEIDRNLDQYGRLDRMATDTEPATQNGSSKKNKTSSARSKIDYLTEQRIERAEKEKVDELEKYLKLCTYNDPSAMDYSGLFDCEPQATQNNCRRNASSSPVGEEESDWRTDDYETELRNTKKSKKKAPSSPAKEDMSLDLVPQYGKVLVKRSSNESGISYAFHKEQIVRLIENAKDGAELSLKEHSSSSDGDSDSAVYSTAAADDIKALLSQYQDHITTLSCLRKQQISSSSSYSPKIPPQLRPPLSSSSSSLPPSSYDPSDPFDCLFFNAMDQSLPLSPTNHTNATINPTNQLNPANPPGLFPPIPSAETRPSPPTAQNQSNIQNLRSSRVSKLLLRDQSHEFYQGDHDNTDGDYPLLSSLSSSRSYPSSSSARESTEPKTTEHVPFGQGTGGSLRRQELINAVLQEKSLSIPRTIFRAVPSPSSQQQQRISDENNSHLSGDRREDRSHRDRHRGDGDGDGDGDEDRQQYTLAMRKKKAQSPSGKNRMVI